VLLEGDSVGRGNTEDLALPAACRRPSLDTQFYALALGVPVDPAKFDVSRILQLDLDLVILGNIDDLCQG
jgi:hypothetical protein